MAGQRLTDLTAGDMKAMAERASSQPPHPYRAILAAADDDRGAVPQRPTATVLTGPKWPEQGSPTWRPVT